MTDRWNGFIVTLDRDIREDDAQPILDALRMVKGVQTVQPSVSSPGAAAIAEMQIRAKIATEMHEAAGKILRGGD